MINLCTFIGHKWHLIRVGGNTIHDLYEKRCSRCPKKISLKSLKPDSGYDWIPSTAKSKRRHTSSNSIDTLVDRPTISPP